MMQTEQLIEQLAGEPRAARSLPSPLRTALILGTLMLAYGAGSLCFMGLRPDLTQRFADPLYVAELTLLLLFTFSCVLASAALAFPDQHQQRLLARMPLVFLLGFVAVSGWQTVQMAPVSFLTDLHGMSCTLCIAALAAIPAALILVILRRGATTHPRLAAGYAVSAATGIGLIALRLEEAGDDPVHLILWHLLPTFFFALIGALAGRKILQW